MKSDLLRTPAAARRGVLLVLLSSLAVLTACEPPSRAVSAFKGTDITGADYAKALNLPDAEGRPRSLEEFKGKVIFVFFGYTQCPDVCPTTMADLAEARRLLGADGDRVQGIFVTVDPERDTADILKAYTRSLDPTLIGLRTTPQGTAEAARAFKVFYNKVPGKSGGGYSIDHTAGAYVFDPQGRVRLFVRYGTGPQALAEDLKKLIDGA